MGSGGEGFSKSLEKAVSKPLCAQPHRTALHAPGTLCRDVDGANVAGAHNRRGFV